jgi:hypothetical protein
MFSLREKCMTALVAGAAFAAVPAVASAATGQTSKVPAPPAVAGCYEYTNGGWDQRQCASPSYIAQHIPHPEVLAGVGETASPSTGSFDLGIVSAKPIVGGSDTDSTYGAGYYSLQDNAFFTGSNGDQDGVQFTDQSGGGIANVCVWQVKVTAPQVYTPVCIPFPSSITGRITLVEGFAVSGLLGTVVEGTKSGVLFSAMVPDMYGLGSKGRWNNNSGSVLGYGNGSEAVFTKTEERIGVSAASCMNATGPVAWTYACTAKPLKPAGYVGYSPGPMGYGISTVESNNLVPVIGSPPAFLPALSYPNTHTESTTYVASTSGKCFSGTPPTCG